MPDERGTGYSTVEKCRAFVESGVGVELLAPKRRQIPDMPTDIWDYYQIPPETFACIRLWTWELPIVSIFEPIVKHSRYSLMSWTFSLRTLMFLMNNKRKVVYFYSDLRELLFLLKLVRPFYNPIVIVEFHYVTNDWYSRVVEGFCLDRPDLFVTTTSYVAMAYQERSVPKQKTMICPGGVRLGDFDYRTTKTKLRRGLGLPVNRFIVGYAGRFVTLGDEKGISDLLKAAAMLATRRVKVMAVCVGGPEKYVTKYRDQARHMGLTKDALILGHVPRLTLFRFERAFDVTVLPFPWTPHFAYNMSPLKMFEGLAAKNPIVATDLPSIREVLRDGENAILVSPGSATELAGAVLRLRRDKKLGVRLANRAYREAVSKYTWVKRARLILAAIK